MNQISSISRVVMGLMLSLSLASVFAADNAPADSRYVAQKDTVYDTKTKLTWARCSVGQQWSEANGCTGEIQTFNFPAAQELQKGHWRLPTKQELGTLIDEKRVAQKQIPAIDVAAFPATDNSKLAYWTGTTAEDENVWMVYFRDGSIGFSHVSAHYAVRLVQDGTGK